MSTYVQSVLLENLAAIRSQIEWSSDEDGLVPAISCWLDAKSEAPEALKKTILEHVAASRSYRAVAAAGFLVAAGVRDPAVLEFFDTGTTWLLNKAPIVDGIPTGIAVDGLAVFGVTIGQLVIDAKRELKQWIALLKEAESKRADGEALHRSALKIACALLDGDDYLPTATDSPELCLSLHAKGNFHISGAMLQSLCDGLYYRLRTLHPSQIANEELVLALYAYNWVESNAIASTREVVIVNDLTRLLGRLESSFYRWTWEEEKRTPDSVPERWDIQNEYHFQNFLWAVLKPVFPDLKEEEYVASVGPVQSRTDLLIPSLKVIIEVKYRRKRMSENTVTREIAEDLGLYRHKRSDLLGIIPVIWDEVSRSEETAHLIAGLKEMEGIIDAFVVTRPSKMV
jgi:hypothetical protein